MEQARAAALLAFELEHLGAVHLALRVDVQAGAVHQDSRTREAKNADFNDSTREKNARISYPCIFFAKV